MPDSDVPPEDAKLSESTLWGVDRSGKTVLVKPVGLPFLGSVILEPYRRYDLVNRHWPALVISEDGRWYHGRLTVYGYDRMPGCGPGTKFIQLTTEGALELCGLFGNIEPPEELVKPPVKPAASPTATPWEDEKAAPASGTVTPEDPAPLVILGKLGDKPTVRGKPKNPLTVPRYNVIKALLDAGENGLTGDALATKSGHGGAVNTLKTLAKGDPDWKAVISLPGKPGCRYRIVGKTDGC